MAAPRIDLNHATVDELTTLEGVPPACARAIVEWREGHGPFRDFAELGNIKGIDARAKEVISNRTVLGHD